MEVVAHGFGANTVDMEPWPRFGEELRRLGRLERPSISASHGAPATEVALRLSRGRRHHRRSFSACLALTYQSDPHLDPPARGAP